MVYYASRHSICLIDPPGIEVLKRIGGKFICGTHLMKLGFWSSVEFEAWMSHFLGVLSSYYHWSYLGSENCPLHSQDLRFWSLIGHLLTHGAKLGFWVKSGFLQVLHSNLISLVSICWWTSMVEILRLNLEWKQVNWSQGAKWSFWSKSVKVRSWPSGLLVNHQFKDHIFIFHDQIHHWIKEIEEIGVNLFLKKLEFWNFF